MPRERLLFIGSTRANPARAALEASSARGPGIWVVPTEASRRWARSVASETGDLSKIVTWDEFWTEAALRSEALPPARLSGPARGLLIDAAVERTRAEEGLGPIESLVSLRGYRRQLRERFSVGPPVAADPVSAAESALYRRYVEIRDAIGRADESGFREWAANEFVLTLDDLDDELRRVVVLSADDLSASARSVCERWIKRADSFIAAASADTPESGAWWVDRGFTKTVVADDSDAGPTQLADEVGSEIEDEPIPIDGLRVLGGPGSEGQARLIAAEIRRVPPDGRAATVLLVPRWNRSTREIVNHLADFGVSVQPPPSEPTRSDPAVILLLRICRLPIDDWPVAEVVKALRHGGLALGWVEGAKTEPDPTRVAAALVGLGVHRGVRAVAARLAEVDRGGTLIPVIESLAELVSRAASGSTWRDHVSNLEWLAASLGVADAPAIRAIFDHLEDLSDLRDALRIGDDPTGWDDFVAALETIADEEDGPDRRSGDFDVETYSVDDFVGARADRLILIDLTEGSFPAESALRGTAEEKSAAYLREAARFRRAVASADRELILTYPTVDDEGEELLPAGFLDGFLRRLPADRPEVHVKYKRFDPVFFGREDLALTPNDLRVLATAEACRADSPRPARIAALAADPRHRPALLGAAAALEVRHARFGVDEFGPFDGFIASDRVAAELRHGFGPDAVFSPSQIESYLWCPFQFFLKYVLHLRPPEERGELDLDYARFGSRVHDILENVHIALCDGRDDPTAPLAEEIGVAIRTHMAASLTVARDDLVADAMLSIEEERARRLLDRYAEEYGRYLEGEGKGFVPGKFEIEFGPRGADKGSGEVLTIGEGEDRVRLQGKIDRVDLVQSEDGVRFRIIDYKTFSVPSNRDAAAGLYVQLPLYALAVERLGLLGRDRTILADMGYWGLSKKGFARIKPSKEVGDHAALLKRVEEVVIDAVRELRTGDFSVAPKKPDCSRACDYRTVCRVGEVRSVGKTRSGEPTPEAERPEVRARD